MLTQGPSFGTELVTGSNMVPRPPQSRGIAALMFNHTPTHALICTAHTLHVHIFHPAKTPHTSHHIHHTYAPITHTTPYTPYIRTYTHTIPHTHTHSSSSQPCELHPPSPESPRSPDLPSRPCSQLTITSEDLHHVPSDEVCHVTLSYVM